MTKTLTILFIVYTIQNIKSMKKLNSQIIQEPYQMLEDTNSTDSSSNTTVSYQSEEEILIEKNENKGDFNIYSLSNLKELRTNRVNRYGLVLVFILILLMLASYIMHRFYSSYEKKLNSRESILIHIRKHKLCKNRLRYEEEDTV